MASNSAKKKSAKKPAAAAMKPLPGETVIQCPGGTPVGIAIRTSHNAQTGEERMLITIRAGKGCENIKFNFGGNGGGVVVYGGDPGDPPCP